MSSLSCRSVVVADGCRKRIALGLQKKREKECRNYVIIPSSGAKVKEVPLSSPIILHHREEEEILTRRIRGRGIDFRSLNLVSYRFEIKLLHGGCNENLSHSQVIIKSQDANQTLFLRRSHGSNFRDRRHFLQVGMEPFNRR